mmetsp:Transcript_23861/g.51446  ORF Transcript_23861/g.51446 Transcript_23861/m.51446 type:complete len:260 (-) Transcript_23861:692-1471(-)
MLGCPMPLTADRTPCRSSMLHCRSILGKTGSSAKDNTQLVVHEILWRRGELGIALDHLVDRLDHVFLSHRLPPAPDSEHARLDADGADVGAGCVGAKPCEEFEADVSLAVHRARVDLEDVGATLEVGQAELHLAVQAAGTQQSGVERIRPVGRHQDLDVASGLEAVELVDDLKHGALHLIIAAGAVVEAGAADSIYLVYEDDACLLGTSHLEELAHHPRTLTHVLLHQLGANHPDEAGVGAVGDGARGEGLAGAGRTVE